MLLQRLKLDFVPELKLNSIQKEAKNLVQKKVLSGIYELEVISCPVCSENESTIVGEKDRYGLAYRTNICSSCGLVFTNPRMNYDAYSSFYNQEYRQLYVGKARATAHFFESQQRRGKRIYNYLLENKLIKESKTRVLEVGCGAGGILDYFKSKGCDIEGIDLGEEYINYGIKEYQLPLSTGSLAHHKLSFTPDIIIYSHVMEHILDLNAELQLIKKISHKDTILYIEVPGIKSVHISFRSNILRYFQNAHTFHFSLESLKNILSKNGFELIVGDQLVRSAFRINDHTFSIKNDFREIEKYLLQIEKKRRYYGLTTYGIKENLIRVILWGLRITGLKSFVSKLRNQ